MIANTGSRTAADVRGWEGPYSKVPHRAMIPPYFDSNRRASSGVRTRLRSAVRTASRSVRTVAGSRIGRSRTGVLSRVYSCSKLSWTTTIRAPDARASRMMREEHLLFWNTMRSKCSRAKSSRNGFSKRCRIPLKKMRASFAGRGAGSVTPIFRISSRSPSGPVSPFRTGYNKVTSSYRAEKALIYARAPKAPPPYPVR